MFGSRVRCIHVAKIAGQHFAAGSFVLPLALKDVRPTLAETEMAPVPMLSVNVVHDRLLAGIAKGYANLDWSALGLVAAEKAGLTQEGMTS